MLSADTILFDLFGTVVHFASRVPTVSMGGTARRTTLGWLQEPVARALPDLPFATFLESVAVVTKEIIAARPPEFVEVTSPERFQRALERLGVDAASAGDLGTQLSEVHMRNLTSLTELPPGHREVLASLRGRYRLGLVSNFDHQAAAERVLAMHGVAPYFESVTISAGFGRRKPHPSIFEHAMRALGASPERTVFVGDSLEDDVVGAKAAGMAAVWICDEETANNASSRADAVIPAFTELPSILA